MLRIASNAPLRSVAQVLAQVLLRDCSSSMPLSQGTNGEACPHPSRVPHSDQRYSSSRAHSGVALAPPFEPAPRTTGSSGIAVPQATRQCKRTSVRFCEMRAAPSLPCSTVSWPHHGTPSPRHFRIPQACLRQQRVRCPPATNPPGALDSSHTSKPTMVMEHPCIGPSTRAWEPIRLGTIISCPLDVNPEANQTEGHPVDTQQLQGSTASMAKKIQGITSPPG